jgi:DNA mismatch repair protein MutS
MPRKQARDSGEKTPSKKRKTPSEIRTGSSDTPLMRQYLRIKAEHQDKILFFRMGDFYEMFFEDAVTVSSLLGIALTSRDKGPNPIPMAGVPHHAAEGYISRMITAGHKVAVCDQMEPPSKGKKIVRREVTRVITPGTMLSEDLLKAGKNNFLCALADNQEICGLAALDLSTGEFSCQEVARPVLADELHRLAPAELLIAVGDSGPDGISGLIDTSNIPVSQRPDQDFETVRSRKKLLDHFGVQSLEAFGCEDMPEAQRAAGAILFYLQANRQDQLPHIRSLRPLGQSDCLGLDRWTIRNLELVETIRQGLKQNSLLSTLDKTCTPMGARLLRSWLLWPLIDSEAIRARLDAVGELAAGSLMRPAVRELLSQVRDLQRLAARLGTRRANPRDLLTLAGGLEQTPRISGELAPASGSKLRALADSLEEKPPLAAHIMAVLNSEAPARIESGSVIRTGYNAELDSLRGLQAGGRQWMAEFEASERKGTGITSLKIKHNSVFGYYIEVTKSNLKLVPEHYRRRQTLVNAERYSTEELAAHEVEILEAEGQISALEKSIYAQLLEEAVAAVADVQETARALAELDCLASLAEVASSRGYLRPTITDGDSLRIRDGRHPTLEVSLPRGETVPNDLELDRSQNQLMIITGPNMAGKSTYIRQVALLTIMAQMGSFLPADSAEIGICDRIFTRVGASDDISRGQSTFMVEMTETAFILNNLTDRSLIILDEVGRGTSTFDGLATAWAVAEYLHEHPTRPRTMFATHFHELTELAEAFPRTRNFNVAVKEWGNKITFVHRIVPGAAPKSYGIHVARLAGLPEEAVERAREVLDILEGREYGNGNDPVIAAKRRRRKKRIEQPTLFGPPPSPTLEHLRELKTESLTPLEAQQELARLQQLASKEN